jgi:hypothetical protein
MRPMKFTPALLALALLAPPQDKKGAPDKQESPKEGVLWQATWEEALTEATLRNVPIIFVLHGDNLPNMEQHLEELRTTAFITGSRDFVMVAMCRNAAHGSETVKVDGKDVTRCRRYQRNACSAHLNMWDAVVEITANEFASPVLPSIWYLAPGGTFLQERKHVNGAPIPGADILKDAKQVMGKLGGEHMSYDKYQLMLQARRDWKEGWEKGEWKRAMDAATALRASSSGIFRLEGKAALNKMSDKGDQLLREARSVLGSSPAEGARLLRVIADSFKPFAASRRAQELLAATKTK